IVADRDSVALEAGAIAVDVLEARRRLAKGTEGLGAADLEALAALYQGEFLEGLELPNCPEFEAWRAAEREEARALHRSVLEALVRHGTERPAEALPYARALAAAEPYAVSAHVSLLRLLVAAGRTREAEEQFAASRRVVA